MHSFRNTPPQSGKIFFFFLFLQLRYLVHILFFEALLQKLEVLDKLVVVLRVKLDLFQRDNA